MFTEGTDKLNMGFHPSAVQGCVNPREVRLLRSFHIYQSCLKKGSFHDFAKAEMVAFFILFCFGKS
jgi:CDP-diacylglycerol pyrophosphatase